MGNEAAVTLEGLRAQLRMQGKKTAKRRNKKDHFYKRPDNKFTEKRKTLSYAKTE